MLQAATLLQQSSLLNSPTSFLGGKNKSSTSKAPLSTAAPSCSLQPLPVVWALRQPRQDLESCWHSSTMATAAAVLGKAFPCRWRQDRHNEKPGPLSTNKIIQGLSMSLKPEAGRAEPFSADSNAQQTHLGLFSKILLPETAKNGLFCLIPQSEHRIIACSLLLPAILLWECWSSARSSPFPLPVPQTIPTSCLEVTEATWFQSLLLISSDVTDFSFCYAPEDGHRVDLRLMRIFPAETHSCCNQSPTLTSSTLSLLLCKISCTSCPMSASFLLHQAGQSPPKLAKYCLTSANYMDNNGLLAPMADLKEILKEYSLP